MLLLSLASLLDLTFAVVDADAAKVLPLIYAQNCFSDN
jgi:hypothetical protein